MDNHANTFERIGYFFWNQDTQFLHFDSLCQAILGHRQLRLPDFFAICHPYEKEEITNCFTALLQDGIPFRLSLRVICAGEYRLVTLSASCIDGRHFGSLWNAQQEDFVLAGYLQDLRELSEKVTELENEQSVLADSMEHSPISFVALTQNKVCYITPGAAALLDVDLGDAFSAIFPLQNEREALLEELAANSLVNWKTMHLQKKDDTQPQVRVYAHAGDYAGEDALQLWIVSDGEVTISDEEIRLAQDIAAQNAKAKSAYIVDMGHEIRTPIDMILGLSTLMCHSGLSEKQTDYIEKMEQSAHALLRTFNHILDFTKADVGKLETAKVEFCLSDIFMQIQPIVSTNTAEKGLKYTMHCEADLEEILCGNPIRLSQVLLNLLDNAVQFTNCGTVSLSVKEQARQEGQITLLFSVTDTGIGMSPSQVKLLFAPLSHSEFAVNRKYGGTGLSLMISKELVQHMGGKIYCESKVDQGSVFSFTCVFDCAVNQQDAQVPDFFEGNEARYDDSDPGKNAQLRILVAEDIEINRMIIREILEYKGYKPDFATNGTQALEMVLSQPFDIVFMDIRMPYMDGLEATREIRKQEAYANLPIIAMTAHAAPGDRERSLKAGMDSHIPKPIEAGLLYQAIRHWAR